ncbi:hypothetical protein Catovirus_1_619 [Catovirus CTV1]|uniref:Uncharacterized protein n=1 Tax=Catovirus CTV1 TaxID=1977631 RepID=A0A1V0SA45_9VIRU|nr:hypothetical protein Catovirus_1_619 [Catovirus CTV1]
MNKILREYYCDKNILKLNGCLYDFNYDYNDVFFYFDEQNSPVSFDKLTYGGLYQLLYNYRGTGFCDFDNNRYFVLTGAGNSNCDVQITCQHCSGSKFYMTITLKICSSLTNDFIFLVKLIEELEQKIDELNERINELEGKN